MAQVRPFRRGNERGQAIVEYAMIVALVGACLVFILGVVGKAASGAYKRSAVSLGAKPGYHGGSGVVLTGASSGGRGGRVPTQPPPDSTAADGSQEEPGDETTTAWR